MHQDSVSVLRDFNEIFKAMQAPAVLRVGFDIVQISRIGESLERFGEAFTRRLFTDQEITDVTEAQELNRPSLAARFAAKEAVIKALGLSEAGVGWRDIEVLRHQDGHCELRLHGQGASRACDMGLRQWHLSLSHEGDYAGAVVIGSSGGAA
jgi:holo-[acyl-carrier protein] synthase